MRPGNAFSGPQGRNKSEDHVKWRVTLGKGARPGHARSNSRKFPVKGQGRRFGGETGGAVKGLQKSQEEEESNREQCDCPARKLNAGTDLSKNND